MGRFTDFVLRGRFASGKPTGKQPFKKRGIKRFLTVNFWHHNENITSQKLSWNYSWAPESYRFECSEFAQVLCSVFVVTTHAQAWRAFAALMEFREIRKAQNPSNHENKNDFRNKFQEREFSPMRKFWAGHPCEHPAKNFGQALQILEKQAFRNGHPTRTSMTRLRSEKLRADFSFPKICVRVH